MQYSVKIKGKPLYMAHDNVNGLPCYTLSDKGHRAIFDSRSEALGVAEVQLLGKEAMHTCYAVEEK